MIAMLPSCKKRACCPEAIRHSDGMLEIDLDSGNPAENLKRAVAKELSYVGDNNAGSRHGVDAPANPCGIRDHGLVVDGPNQGKDVSGSGNAVNSKVQYCSPQSFCGICPIIVKI